MRDLVKKDEIIKVQRELIKAQSEQIENLKEYITLQNKRYEELLIFCEELTK